MVASVTQRRLPTSVPTTSGFANELRQLSKDTFTMTYRNYLCLAVAMAICANATLGDAAIFVSVNPADFSLTPQSFAQSHFSTNNLTSTSAAITLVAGVGVGDPPTIDHGYLDFTSALPGDEYVINGDENFDVVFSSLQGSFAYDYVDDSMDSTFILNFFNGAANVGSTSITTFAPFGVSKFIGFTSDAPFDRVEIREFDGNTNSDEYAQFYTAIAVPEPASVVLVTAIAVGLALLRSGRRQA